MFKHTNTNKTQHQIEQLRETKHYQETFNDSRQNTQHVNIHF